MDYEKAKEFKRKFIDSNIISADGDIAKSFFDIFPELAESENERIRKALVDGVRQIRCKNGITQEQMLAWLEKQKEQKPVMIQWTGKNLKEVIDFTGKSPKFGEWFKSWEDFENYVHSHDDILKLFCEDGSHYEVPVGAWIVKTSDGYNIPSQFKFVQKPSWKPSEEQIKALYNFAHTNFFGDGDVEALRSLYEDLKKL